MRLLFYGNRSLLFYNKQDAISGLYTAGADFLNRSKIITVGYCHNYRRGVSGASLDREWLVLNVVFFINRKGCHEIAAHYVVDFTLHTGILCH